MPMIFFEADKLKDLSTIDLIHKQQEIEEKLSNIKKNLISPDILASMNMMNEYYNNEIERRIISGDLDMDEIEEIEEENFFKNLNNGKSSN